MDGGQLRRRPYLRLALSLRSLLAVCSGGLRLLDRAHVVRNVAARQHEGATGGNARRDGGARLLAGADLDQHLAHVRACTGACTVTSGELDMHALA